MKVFHYRSVADSVNILLTIVISTTYILYSGCKRSRIHHLDGRIVGGTGGRIQDYPYQVSFEVHGIHMCGASIINEFFVVTAAHCVEKRPIKATRIRAGSTYRERGGTLHAIDKVIMHPKYNTDTLEHDIALIKVVQKFVMGHNVWPISLAWSASKPGTFATVTGWGRTHPDKPVKSPVLQFVNMTISPRTVCQSVYSKSNKVVTNKFCLGSSMDGTDSCQGDSGGPAMSGGVLIGIVSFGGYCGDHNTPGAYTDVYKYFYWIHQNSKS